MGDANEARYGGDADMEGRSSLEAYAGINYSEEEDFEDAEAKDAYAFIMIVVCILCAPIVPTAGVFSDKV